MENSNAARSIHSFPLNLGELNLSAKGIIRIKVHKLPPGYALPRLFIKKLNAVFLYIPCSLFNSVNFIGYEKEPFPVMS